jgi:hypothetical protein
MNTGSRVHGTQVGSVCLCVFCISAQRAMCAVSGLSVRSIVGVCVRVCVCVCVCTTAMMTTVMMLMMTISCALRSICSFIIL